MMVLKYTDKRDVIMLSTIDEFGMATVPKRKGRKEGDVKPIVILNHNKNMGGVDLTDMLLSSTESVRKTIKWYKKVFFHLLDLSVLNSHILFKQVTGKKLPLKNFIENLIEQLIEEN